MIDDEVPIIVERNCLHFEEVESDIHSIYSNLPIPILFENCDDTKDSKILITYIFCSLSHAEA